MSPQPMHVGQVERSSTPSMNHKLIHGDARSRRTRREEPDRISYARPPKQPHVRSKRSHPRHLQEPRTDPGRRAVQADSTRRTRSHFVHPAAEAAAGTIEAEPCPAPPRTTRIYESITNSSPTRQGRPIKGDRSSPIQSATDRRQRSAPPRIRVVTFKPPHSGFQGGKYTVTGLQSWCRLTPILHQYCTNKRWQPTPAANPRIHRFCLKSSDRYHSTNVCKPLLHQYSTNLAPILAPGWCNGNGGGRRKTR